MHLCRAWSYLIGIQGSCEQNAVRSMALSTVEEAASELAGQYHHQSLIEDLAELVTNSQLAGQLANGYQPIK